MLKTFVPYGGLCPSVPTRRSDQLAISSDSVPCGIKFSLESVIRFYFFFITVLFAICGTKLDEFGVCSIRTINFDRAIQSEMNY